MSGCFGLRRVSICASVGFDVEALARRRVSGQRRRRVTVYRARRGHRRRALAVGRRVGEEALENQLAIAVARQRLDRGLQRELGVLDRLHVGLRLRGQAAVVRGRP